ncbi:glycerol-3-phosphate regulon repressor [Rodentibacter pneumotropicus]|uniref:Glycerol-3-phosphate regulon repressor n=1 Tax=Rodentibacter pneumotropicus TaxID=758 RepID=A0A448MJI7_9PAST|nr:glycerol-3-phosphate regulon repressor [Rodentibacter pneumotropicus]
MLDYDYHEVQVKRAIMESSRQTLLVTDHSKFTRQAIVRLGELEDVEYLFTDEVPFPISQYLQSVKTKLVIC